MLMNQPWSCVSRRRGGAVALQRGGTTNVLSITIANLFLNQAIEKEIELQQSSRANGYVWSARVKNEDNRQYRVVVRCLSVEKSFESVVECNGLIVFLNFFCCIQFLALA